MPEYRILSLAPGTPTPEGDVTSEWAFQVESGTGQRVAITFAPADAQNQTPDPIRAMAIAADLLRPGWDALARTDSPEIVGTRVFRGCRLIRQSRVDQGGWNLSVVFAGELEADTPWETIVAMLDDFHCSVSPNPGRE